MPQAVPSGTNELAVRKAAHHDIYIADDPTVAPTTALRTSAIFIEPKGAAAVGPQFLPERERTEGLG